MRSFSVFASLSMAVRYQPMGVPAVRTLSRPIANMPRILLADQPAGTDDAAARKTGVVKWFNTQKGFGFITPADGTPDVFVHQTAIYAPGFRSLAEGESVEYEIETSTDGRIRALSVTGPNGDYVQGAPRDPFFGGN